MVTAQAMSFTTTDCATGTRQLTMKTLRLLLGLGTVGLFAAALPATALTTARLSLKPGAGLELAGALGSSYTIEYTTNLAQPNSWRHLTNLTLPASPYVVPGTTPSATGCRFYRATVVPVAPAQLSLQRDSGLTITGTVGALYAIEYATNLTQPMAWRPLTNLTLLASPYLVPGTAPSTTGSRFYRAIGSVASTSVTNMVFIQPGTFTLGSPLDEEDRYPDEGPQTTVTISHGFWMGSHPVTQQEYTSITGNNPSYFTGDPTRPVEQVSWTDATNYCRLLTQRELSAGRISAGYQYRLPTEAEWEYACRAGTSTRFYYGDDPSYADLAAHAWCADNSDDQTQPVGQKPPNPWGLYDMCGNVWQWCQDWYGTYPGGSATDPQGSATGTGRILRGGSYYDPGWLCRSACRIDDNPAANYYDNYGFRVVLAPAGP
jgi:formylglycine-generating enzyme required for sulfatase activity